MLVYIVLESQISPLAILCWDRQQGVGIPSFKFSYQLNNEEPVDVVSGMLYGGVAFISCWSGENMLKL
jgi:hypothetical protein